MELIGLLLGAGADPQWARKLAISALAGTYTLVHPIHVLDTYWEDDPTIPRRQSLCSVILMLHDASRCSRVKAYPGEHYTTASVEEFLNNTNSFLYLRNQDKAKGLIKSVYASDRGPSPGDAVQVFTMAAVGIYLRWVVVVLKKATRESRSRS
jgi:hypothetical protein